MMKDEGSEVLGQTHGEVQTVDPADAPVFVVKTPRVSGKPFSKRLIMWIRRGHLYFGLFLFPWAILYGVTAFLFNHPTAFSDQSATNFSSSAIQGTTLGSLASPQAIAQEVVAKLNETQKPTTPYLLAGDAKFGREFAFATVKVEGHTVSVLVDAKDGTGTLRKTAVVERKTPEPAPFAVGRSNTPTSGREPRGGGERSGRPARAETTDTLMLAAPMHEQIKAALPTVLERSGFPTGEVTITSVPDVIFPIEVEGRIWTATYNGMTGTVSGLAQDAKAPTELSVRRFLLRLHTAHGYPGEVNSRWLWAVIVDAMAFIMCFWALSGLLMWWQIKATRKIGLVMLVLSAIAATGLGVAMHMAMTS